VRCAPEDNRPQSIGEAAVKSYLKPLPGKISHPLRWIAGVAMLLGTVAFAVIVR